jgi:xylulokinase
MEMNKKRLSLGLDLSTQSISAVAIDIDRRTKVAAHSLDYARDPRLNVFGIRSEDYILPPRSDGEADQPPLMFLAALDAMFADLKRVFALQDVAVINVSGQQHGHVYLNSNAPVILAGLNKNNSEHSSLPTLLKDSFAYERAPIWMTSNTARQTATIRDAVGGRERLIRLSGSDAQLRFTGIIVRRTAEQFPDIHRRTAIIQLLSSFVPAVLAADATVPADFGNACGMSLMNYRRKRWSNALLRAVSGGLPGGAGALRRKLPTLAAPDSVIGTIAPYFIRKYGFSPACRIAAGSGDNPQSKVLVAGDLLSLGSSFVYMVATNGKTFDMSGAASAMYDGVGRPFMFGCRTNGSLVWDGVRALYGLNKDDYALAETALQHAPVGKNLVFWQPRTESFPPSGNFVMVRDGNGPPTLESDYAGIIESSLAAVYSHSKSFGSAGTSPLYVMGGATGSPGIMRRVAAIWDRPVIVTEKAGAALGAAVAGVSVLLKSENEPVDVDEISTSILGRGSVVRPVPEDVAAFHSSGGYLDRFVSAEAKLLENHPL